MTEENYRIGNEYVETVREIITGPGYKLPRDPLRESALEELNRHYNRAFRLGIDAEPIGTD